MYVPRYDWANSILLDKLAAVNVGVVLNTPIGAIIYALRERGGNYMSFSVPLFEKESVYRYRRLVLQLPISVTSAGEPTLAGEVGSARIDTLLQSLHTRECKFTLEYYKLSEVVPYWHMTATYGNLTTEIRVYAAALLDLVRGYIITDLARATVEQYDTQPSLVLTKPYKSFGGDGTTHHAEIFCGSAKGARTLQSHLIRLKFPVVKGAFHIDMGNLWKLNGFVIDGSQETQFKFNIPGGARTCNFHWREACRKDPEIDAYWLEAYMKTK